MKEFLLAILVFFVVVLLAYATWAVFIPMTIGQKWVDRKIIENSQQYVESQRSALVTLYMSYTSADDAHRKGILAQMCEISTTISIENVPNQLRPALRGCL